LIANAAPTPRAVGHVLFPALVLTLAFAFSYVGAFHDPKPHAVPVATARSALFFDGARISGPILVLVGWAALGTALTLALGGRIMDPVEVEARAAAGAAV
jgi:hypothetical protein